MRRGERRRWPGAPAAMRWIAADARDVARVERSLTRPAVAVHTVVHGLRRWQRRLERRRRLALLRRTLVVALASAGALQIGALIAGRSGAGPWLLPAALVAAAALALGLARRTSAEAAARLIDRDLGLGARVGTALELESSAAEPQGLAALALTEGRTALAASLAFARARLQVRRGEAALLAGLVAGLALLLVVPSPRAAGTSPRTAGASGRAVPPSSRALRAENGLVTNPGSDPSLQSFIRASPDAPPLAPVGGSATARNGGAASGQSPYSGATADSSATGSVQGTSSTAGQSGAVQGTQDDAGAPSQGAAGTGSLPNGAAAPAKTNPASGASPDKRGDNSSSVAPIPNTRPTGAAPGTASSGSATDNGLHSQGGGGSSAPGSSPASLPGKATPAGAAAGNATGGKGTGSGVVPQLGKSRGALPLALGYESVPGAKATKVESTSSTAGRGGGAGHTGQATAQAAGSGAGTGVPYVPPGGASVAPIDRGVVLGYFASFARVNASGW